ncbi:MAG: hypothetical protein IPP71_19400 [Bacteroidetes bacterium]|nr:hypothetical protein [Bacteroidota bacterium]
MFAEVEFEVINSTSQVIITFDNVTVTYLGVPLSLFVFQGTYIVTASG